MTGEGGTGGGGGGGEEPPAPPGSGGPGGEDIAIAQLDRDFATWASRLTPQELAALRTYQRADRSYEDINALLRGTLDAAALAPSRLREVVEAVESLDSAIAKGALAGRFNVLRGVRSTEQTFGVAAAGVVRSEPYTLGGYLATSVRRNVAIAKFTRPAFGTPATLELAVPAGTPAAWLALVGDPALRGQAELLLDHNTRILVREARHQHGLLILICEVVP